MYSNGNEFHYEYDAVGNILTKVVKLNSITTTTTYTYDDANRLLTVNGVAQQFDANGNLINDGTKTYVYDAANRLKSITQGANVSSYSYNGIGDRVSQTNNGVTTNYSLDLNAGLTQVLSDGTNTYLYGLGRIGEQQPAGFVYHLGDALGSVRQLVDASGVVQLTRSYEPYGETLSSVGSGSSVYQYTGESSDSYIKLYYLRSRWYSGETSRFTSKDSWRDYNRSLSLNGWSYTEGDPINHTDPSGMITCDNSADATCIAMAQDLKTYALALKASVKSGSLMPVEAYAQLAERATINFKDVAGVMWGMTSVLVGVDPNAIEVWKIGRADDYKVQIKTASSPYYIDQDWLPYKHNPAKDDLARGYQHSEIGDWRPEYWDNTPNQAFHSWFFVAVQFYNGSAFANAGNIAHDPYFLEPLCGEDLINLVKGVKSIPRIGPGIVATMPNFGGTSKEDYLLSQKAMELGSGLWWAFNLGPVKVPGSISDPGQWIRANFQNQRVVSPSPSNSGK